VLKALYRHGRHRQRAADQDRQRGRKLYSREAVVARGENEKGSARQRHGLYHMCSVTSFVNRSYMLKIAAFDEPSS
jgi:hypothetical protein